MKPLVSIATVLVFAGRVATALDSLTLRLLRAKAILTVPNLSTTLEVLHSPPALSPCSINSDTFRAFTNPEFSVRTGEAQQ